MKRFISLRIPTVVCCFGVAVAQAQVPAVQTTLFPAPAEYCFEQTSVRGGFDKIILEHHLVVAPEDYFKMGEVFVAARFKSKPDGLWLTNGSYWWDAYNNELGRPVEFATYRALQPVIPVSVFGIPMDVRDAIGDGEIWVGYGLRGEPFNSRASFDEMMRSRRFELVWEAKAPVIWAGMHIASNRICLATTRMKRTFVFGVGIANESPANAPPANGQIINGENVTP